MFNSKCHDPLCLSPQRHALSHSRSGDAFDLLVLKELLEKMTGIEPKEEVSDKQVGGL